MSRKMGKSVRQAFGIALAKLGEEFGRTWSSSMAT